MVDCVTCISSSFVKHTCCFFWTFLIFDLILSLAGVVGLNRRAKELNQTSVFTPASDWDWSVDGKEQWIVRDMVYSAFHLALMPEAGSRRRLSAIPMQSEEAHDESAINFLYYARSESDNLFTPPMLKELCDVENHIFSTPGYGKTCLHNPANGGLIASDGERFCSMPRYSVVSLFYRTYDASKPHDLAALQRGYGLVEEARTAATAAAASLSGVAPAAPAPPAVATAIERASAAHSALVEAQWSALDGTLSSLGALLVGLGPPAAVTPPAALAALAPLTQALDSLEAAAASPAEMSEKTAGAKILFDGWPLRGMPTNAPLLADAATLLKPGTFERQCAVLDAEYVASRAQQIFDLAHSSPAMLQMVAYFLSAGALAANVTNATRARVTFGAPRPSPYEQELQLEDWSYGVEDRLWKAFGMDQLCLVGAFLCMRSEYRTAAVTEHLQVKWTNGAWIDEEFTRIVTHDQMMAAASCTFVFIYICIHTSSFALGCFAILQIILSMPMALFFYVLIFQIPYFAQVHILALFIILGVGADDIFVFTDAWRQTASMASMTTLTKRMSYTYRRTAVTVLNTSLTTAIAFFATSTAPIIPIASFGVFAATMILLNWYSCITFWPCVMLVHETYFCRARCIGCCFSCDGCSTPCTIRHTNVVPATSADADAKPGSADAKPGSADAKPGSAEAETSDLGVATQVAQRLSCSERFFRDVYSPALTWHVGGRRSLKPLSLVLVLLMGGLGGYLCYEALTLSTPEEPPVWFPTDHMWTGLLSETQGRFLAGDDDAYMDGALYFGLHKMHAPKYDKWIPAKNRGDVVFDEGMDLSDPAAQAAFKQACVDLRVATCGGAPVCSRPPGDLLASLGSVSCFLEAFEADSGGAVTGSAFEPALKAWLATPAGQPYILDAGFIDGRLRFARIAFVFTALKGIANKKQRQLYDASMAFLEESYFPTAPPTLSVATIDAGRIFAWMSTSEELVMVILQGFAIILPAAFLILLLSNGSFLSAAWATLTVALITGSLLGGCKLAFGFSLGISEAIAGNIVIGLSVDYTLHLSHTYADAPSTTREEKMTHAATVMGVTVLAGAATTFCSSLFMLACQLTFFTDMCTLIGGTVLFSICFALLFFMPMMALIGPQGVGCHDLIARLGERCQPKLATAESAGSTTAPSGSVSDV